MSVLMGGKKSKSKKAPSSKEKENTKKNPKKQETANHPKKKKAPKAKSDDKKEEERQKKDSQKETARNIVSSRIESLVEKMSETVNESTASFHPASSHNTQQDNFEENIIASASAILSNEIDEDDFFQYSPLPDLDEPQLLTPPRQISRTPLSTLPAQQGNLTARKPKTPPQPLPSVQRRQPVEITPPQLHPRTGGKTPRSFHRQTDQCSSCKKLKLENDALREKLEELIEGKGT